MNMNDIEYKVLSGIEQIGSDGVLGIKVMIGGTNLPDFKDDRFKEIGWKAREAVDALIQEIDAARAQMNPEAIERAKTEKEKILACFPSPIFVEEIPNGYCSRGCCRHLPWFIVTTSVGRFKIGWRKSVINIDWSETIGTDQADPLFINENVTKGVKYIHAWSYEKAREYILTIMASAKENA